MTAFSDAPPLGATPPTILGTTWTGTDNFDAALQTLIDLRYQEQLRSPLPYLLEGNFLKADVIKKGSNGTLRFLAVGDIPVDVTVDSTMWVEIEGEPNDPVELDFGYEEFSVKQFMQSIRLTDVAMDVDPHSLIATGAEKIARWKMEVLNARAAAAITSGDNTLYAGNGTSNVTVSSAEGMTGELIRSAVAELEVSNVPRFADGFYRAFIHPYVKFDFQGDADDGGWIDVQRYARPGNFLNGEIGTYAGVRFILSNSGGRVANAGQSSGDVFITPIIGPGAFALGDPNSVEQFLTPPGGHDDPAHQSALIAVKGYLGAYVTGAGDNASGPVSGPRYINVITGASKSPS